jgi:energy-coupling factor transporter ATP-binding protein EcfA2
MIFQVPDSQIVATVVEEDVAFGPENLGVPAAELRQRVDWALETVGLAELRQRASHLLSAGQKQRLAIASVLAMRPRCLLLDEATAMLDPQGRRQLLQTVQQLHGAGMTVMAATHNMAEAALAERIVVLSQGQVALQGEPHAVFRHLHTLRALELDLPQAALLARELATRVPGFAPDVLNVAELVDALTRHLGQPAGVSP